MRVTGVRAVPYTYALARPIGDVHLPAGTNVGSDIAVFIDTDEGFTGVAVGMGHGVTEVQDLAPLLIGSDPLSIRALWERMEAQLFKLGVGGQVKLGMASLDCALWDLKAKANGVPLWKELGALQPRVPAYASGLDMPLADDALAGFYQRMAGLGLNAGKLKVGRNLEDDLRRLGVMRDALSTSGRAPILMIDSNEYWTPKQAIRRIRRMEDEFDLVWVEEPAPRRDFIGLRKVSDAVVGAVATGENLDTSTDFANLIRERAVDIVQISYGQGGITPCLQIAELAYAHGLPVTMNNCPGRHMAHLAAALPHHLMMEVIDCGRDQAFRCDISLSNGYLALGDSPGSGIEFDDEALGHLRAARPAESSLAQTYSRAVGAGIHE